MEQMKTNNREASPIYIFLFSHCKVLFNKLHITNYLLNGYVSDVCINLSNNILFYSSASTSFYKSNSGSRVINNHSRPTHQL